MATSLKEKADELAETLKSLKTEDGGSGESKTEETREVSVDDFSKEIAEEISKAISDGKGKKLKTAKARIERIAGYLGKAVEALKAAKEGDEPKLLIFKSADLKVDEAAPEGRGVDASETAKVVAGVLAPVLEKFDETLKALKPKEETKEEKAAKEKKEAEAKKKKETETKKAEDSWPLDMNKGQKTETKKSEDGADGKVDFGSDDPGVKDVPEDSGSGDGGGDSD